MSYAYSIRFRATRANYERLMQEAKSMGFENISDYLRHRLFGPSMIVETLLKENNLMLRDICKNLKINTSKK